MEKDVAVSLLPIPHVTTSLTFETAASMTVDFALIRTTGLQLRFDQNALTGTATVRLRDVTNGVTMATINPAGPGLQLTPVSNIPAGQVRIEVQHLVSGGGESSEIDAVSLVR